ncbi:helix-turn-helix domain-containing protein [Zophobihabitans entericus]|uniref:Transcriptional regulator n=1 Tax=Zophobihabitans entericus TaxID=1635327 RepID=A0A6G9I7Q5_9GAMM|nr:helix-turn-helix transcriptional regulator [Zophobihabitans entericus]QIQ20236.1 transcriptional regulator [Zophobihabitans entericus]
MEKVDWHSSDIIAAFKKLDTSLAEVSRAQGYAPSTLANALVRPWPRGEKIIGAALGIPPEEIWPSRYARRLKLKLKKHVKFDV